MTEPVVVERRAYLSLSTSEAKCASLRPWIERTPPGPEWWYLFRLTPFSVKFFGYYLWTWYNGHIVKSFTCTSIQYVGRRETLAFKPKKKSSKIKASHRLQTHWHTRVIHWTSVIWNKICNLMNKFWFRLIISTRCFINAGRFSLVLFIFLRRVVIKAQETLRVPENNSFSDWCAVNKWVRCCEMKIRDF